MFEFIGFYFSNIHMVLIIFFFIVFFVFFLIAVYSIFNYTETDKHGRKYRRPLFYPGRICPGCGQKIITRIPTCPSCDRDFSQDRDNSNIQHSDS